MFFSNFPASLNVTGTDISPNRVTHPKVHQRCFCDLYPRLFMLKKTANGTADAIHDPRAG
jgi:hypothetical protein